MTAVCVCGFNVPVRFPQSSSAEKMKPPSVDICISRDAILPRGLFKKKRGTPAPGGPQGG